MTKTNKASRINQRLRNLKESTSFALSGMDSISTDSIMSEFYSKARGIVDDANRVSNRLKNYVLTEIEKYAPGFKGKYYPNYR